jgi:hypothetical protein
VVNGKQPSHTPHHTNELVGWLVALLAWLFTAQHCIVVTPPHTSYVQSVISSAMSPGFIKLCSLPKVG